jgi:hypothetical protein
MTFSLHLSSSGVASCLNKTLLSFLLDLNLVQFPAYFHYGFVNVFFLLCYIYLQSLNANALNKIRRLTLLYYLLLLSPSVFEKIVNIYRAMGLPYIMSKQFL